MTLTVLAAGLGSRYGGLKQLDPITQKGEFIIDFSVFDALRAGYSKVVFIILRKNYDAFRESIGKRLEKFIEVDYAFQNIDLTDSHNLSLKRTKPWGTAHALISCKGKIDTPFAVINADDFYGSDAFLKISDYLKNTDKNTKKQHYCMAGYILKNTLTDNGAVSRGVCSIDTDGYLSHLVERKEIRRFEGGAQYRDGERWVSIDSQSVVSMNCFGFMPSALEYISEGFERFLKDGEKNILTDEYGLPDAVCEMIDADLCDLKVLLTNDKWYGVTYKEDKENVVKQLAALIESGKYPNGLWSV